MLRNPKIYFVAALCVLATSPVAAKPAKDRSVVVPTAKQAPSRTDLTPRTRTNALPSCRLSMNKRRSCLGRPNRLSPQSLLGSQWTLSSHAALRNSIEHGSASNG